MPKLLTLATAALSLLLSGAAVAQTESGASPEIACSVNGYDVIIQNPGTAPIAAGTAVTWSVPFARMDGEHTLEAALEPGATVFLTGALGSSFLRSNRPCEAAIG